MWLSGWCDGLINGLSITRRTYCRVCRMHRADMCHHRMYVCLLIFVDTPLSFLLHSAILLSTVPPSLPPSLPPHLLIFLPRSLSHSLTHLLTHSLIHSLTPSLPHCTLSAQAEIPEKFQAEVLALIISAAKDQVRSQAERREEKY